MDKAGATSDHKICEIIITKKKKSQIYFAKHKNVKPKGNTNPKTNRKSRNSNRKTSKSNRKTRNKLEIERINKIKS